jgi:hypothetical protein
MAWTYDPRNVSDSLAKLRLRLGDTNTNDQLLTDEELNVILSDHDVSNDTDSILLVAADAADVIRAKLARNVDRNNLGMSASRSQVQQHYRDLAEDWRAEYQERRGARSIQGEVTVTGLSLDERDGLRAEEDYLQPVFRSDDWDNSSHG